MPYVVRGYEVIGTLKENDCNLQVVKHKVEYVPVILSEEELHKLCENTYLASLNIKIKKNIFDYIDLIAKNYDIGLSQKFDIISYILERRNDIFN